MEFAEVADNKRKIAQVYEMLYPYGNFNGDYAAACIKIRREVKTLCKEHRTDILVLVNRAIDMNVDQYDDNLLLCKNILSILSDTCLGME